MLYFGKIWTIRTIGFLATALFWQTIAPGSEDECHNAAKTGSDDKPIGSSNRRPPRRASIKPGTISIDQRAYHLATIKVGTAADLCAPSALDRRLRLRLRRCGFSSARTSASAEFLAQLRLRLEPAHQNVFCRVERDRRFGVAAKIRMHTR